MAARYSSRSSGSRPVAARYRRRLSSTRWSRRVSTGPLTVSHSPPNPSPSTVRLANGRAARYRVRTRRSVPELHSWPSTRAQITGTAWGRPRSSTVAMMALWLASRKARWRWDRISATAPPGRRGRLLYRAGMGPPAQAGAGQVAPEPGVGLGHAAGVLKDHPGDAGGHGGQGHGHAVVAPGGQAGRTQRLRAGAGDLQAVGPLGDGHAQLGQLGGQGGQPVGLVSPGHR